MKPDSSMIPEDLRYVSVIMHQYARFKLLLILDFAIVSNPRLPAMQKAARYMASMIVPSHSHGKSVILMRLNVLLGLSQPRYLGE